MQLKVPLEKAIITIDKSADEGQRIFDQMELDYQEKREQKIYDANKDNEKYENIYLNPWYRECLKRLRSIFLDNTPIQEFRSPKNFINCERHGVNIKFSNISSHFKTRIGVLQKIYWILSERLISQNESKSPQGRNHPSTSIRLPQNTKWEDLTLRFLDGHTIEILLRRGNKKLGVVNYRDFDLENKKERRPNLQWKLLEALAKEGEAINKKGPSGRQNKLKLSKALKKYFGIEDDPFFDYKKEKVYKLKCRVLPEGEDPSTLRINEIEEHLKEQTPLIYEP
jgi:hypothetical protein